MQNKFWLAIVIVVVTIMGLFVLTGDKKDKNGAYNNYDPAQLQLSDHIFGLDRDFSSQEELIEATQNKVIVVEYADFQCPACRNSFIDVENLKEDFGNDLIYVYRHFPITSIHPNAMAAHRAAVAADRQGFFWQMHDILFVRQFEWSNASNAVALFREYAEELELDMQRYDEDVSSSDAFSRINVDLRSASSIGVTATPTFFVNFVEVPLPTYENLAQLIAEVLTEQD